MVLKPLVNTSPRIQHLMLRLTQYHINVEYKSGKSLFLSDCLSRMSDPANCKEDESLNLQVMSIVSDSEPNLSLTAVKQAIVGDPVSLLLGDLILNGWPDSCKDLEEEPKPYWIHRFNLSLMDGVFYWVKIALLYQSVFMRNFLQPYIIPSKESPKHWPEQGVMHIGLVLPMMC